MRTERSASNLKNWLIGILLFLVVFLTWDARNKQHELISNSDRIERLEGEKAVLYHERSEDIDEIKSLMVERTALQDSLSKQLEAVKKLPKSEKLKLVNNLKPVKSDSTLVCFDEEGIDLLNQLQISHLNALQQLCIADSVIFKQGEVITTDSLLLVKEQETSKEWKAEAQTQKNNSDKQSKKVKFWRGFALITTGIATVSTVISVLK